MLRSFRVAAPLGTALVLAGLAWQAGALAQTPQTQAVTTGSLFIRSGPGTSYAIVGGIPSGATVDVFRCALDYRWCEVSYDGQQGWSGAAFLAVGDQPLAAIAANEGLTLVTFDPSEPFGGPATPAAGGPAPPAEAAAPEVAAAPVFPGAGEVCFYAEPNFGGASFCATMGQADRVLGADWEDTIASLRVGPNAIVETCSDRNYRGDCFVFVGVAATLPASQTDLVSSWRTTGIPNGASYGRACFFTEAGFAGESFCARAGEDDRVINAPFEDAISSVRVTGGVTVTVCDGRSYSGTCETLTASTDQLATAIDNGVSSYQVR